MDKKNLFWMIGMFLVGAIIGVVITFLICYNCNYSCKKSYKESSSEIIVEEQSTDVVIPFHGPLLISADSANAYFKCYMKTPLSIDTLIAFTVNLQQFKAMQTLLAHDSTSTGFRLYMGIVGDPTDVYMVVATDTEGNDKASEIYLTVRKGPCPDLCDDESPITK